jgi:hypothetical protein
MWVHEELVWVHEELVWVHEKLGWYNWESQLHGRIESSLSFN